MAWGRPSNTHATGSPATLLAAPAPDASLPLRQARQPQNYGAMAVIHCFRLLGISHMDITHGLEPDMLDEHGRRMTFDWRVYIRSMTMENNTHEAVGRGITRFCIERFADIPDANAKHLCQVNFVAYHACGRSVRIQPRPHRMTLAVIRHVEPAESNQSFMSHLARSHAYHRGGLAVGAPLALPEDEPVAWPVICTVAGLEGLTDSIRNPEARKFLMGLDRDAESVDLSDGRLFSWPRFLASMPPWCQEGIVSTGIIRFEAKVSPELPAVPSFVIHRLGKPPLAVWPGRKLCVSTWQKYGGFRPQGGELVHSMWMFLESERLRSQGVTLP